MQDGGGIRGPTEVAPGGTIDIEVDSGGSVAVTIPGQPPTVVPVPGGRASIPVPPGLPPGTLVHIVVLGRVPPVGITVQIIETE